VSPSKLIGWFGNSFGYGKTRFYQICKLGYIALIASKFADVNPARYNTSFWDIFTELGSTLEGVEEEAGKHLALMYWKTRVQKGEIGDVSKVWMKSLTPEKSLEVFQKSINKNQTFDEAQVRRMRRASIL